MKKILLTMLAVMTICAQTCPVLVHAETEQVITENNNISTKSANFIEELTEGLDSEQIAVVSMEELSTEMLRESTEMELFVYDNNGNVLGLKVANSVAKNITKEQVVGILEDVSKDEQGEPSIVRIYKYQKCTELPEDDIQVRENRGILGLIQGYTIKTEEPKAAGDEYKSERQMIQNVARGSKGELDKPYRIKTKLQVEGSWFNRAIRSDFPPSVTFFSNQEYSGIDPEVRPPSNSRSFYLQTYAQDYTRAQAKIESKTNEVIETRDAVIKVGSSSIEYSVDIGI